jgi:thiazole biosynthesis enzyme
VKLDDTMISRLIVDAYGKKLTSVLETDVAIVGAGPSGLTAAYYLASRGAKVALFERKLSVGGGMWGGGMMFNEIVVQEEGKNVLDEVGVACRAAGDGYFLADSVECVAGLCFAACRAGATLMNLLSVEDVRVSGEDVTGLVINWSAVEVSKLHVDPLTVGSRFIIDATGHAAEVVRIIERKMGKKLLTTTGGGGEGSPGEHQRSLSERLRHRHGVQRRVRRPPHGPHLRWHASQRQESRTSGPGAAAVGVN